MSDGAGAWFFVLLVRGTLGQGSRGMVAADHGLARSWDVYVVEEKREKKNSNKLNHSTSKSRVSSRKIWDIFPRLVNVVGNKWRWCVEIVLGNKRYGVRKGSSE